jgi:protease I
VSPKVGDIRSWRHTDCGHSVRVDVTLVGTGPDVYDAFVLPGGVINPDGCHPAEGRGFVKASFDAGDSVAAICHSPWTVLEAGCPRGRHMTSVAAH